MNNVLLTTLIKLTKTDKLEIESLIMEFGFESISVPDLWLEELFKKLACKEVCEPIFFKEISIDALNFIEELSEFLGWGYDDFDERKIIDIFELNRRVYLDLNAADEKLGGGCAYSIVEL